MSGALNHKSKGKERAILSAGLLVLAIGLVIFLLEAALGLHLFEFADETEKFVAAQMIAHGQHLYRDIFAHHGPVAYIIAHLYTVLVSQNDFTHIRIFQVLLALLSSSAIFFTPVLKSTVARVWSVGAYLFLLSSVWIVQGMHMILYQQIGGFLFAIAFLHLFVPLFFDIKPNKYGVMASGCAVVVSCFSAYAFGPSAVLLIAASMILLFAAVERGEWKTVLYPFVIGMLLGLALILFWMFLFADLKGFYIYHFYFNQQIYTQYIRFSPKSVLNIFSFSFAQQKLVHTFALSLFGVWGFYFIVSAIKKSSTKFILARVLAFILIILSVAYMNPRGETGFQDNAFIIVNFALFVLVGGLVLQRQINKDSFAEVLCTLFFILLAVLLIGQGSKDVLSNPHQIKRNEWKDHLVFMKTEEGGIYEFVRSLTKKEGDLLCLVFNPIHYIKADRLPASGHYYYLPWQAAYNRKPLAGYKIDICKDMQSQAPAVIVFDNWKVRGFIPLEKYASCILSIIKNNYVRLQPDSQLFVRKDLLVGKVGTEKGETRQIKLSPPLNASSPLRLLMTPDHQSRNAGLKRIGIMFGTSVGQNRGEFELRLKGPDGAEFTQHFSLADFVENTYRYFALDAKHYTTGELISQAGGSGISTWESYDEQGAASTCITYEYTDGKRGFTPGCPLY
ncbi:MAG: hypothetical protein ACYC9M_05285 [Desulfobulbaceae bacterium]